MRRSFLLALVSFAVACGNSSRPHGPGGFDATAGGEACTGLECLIVDCSTQGGTSTSLSGTVYAPNGTLALYGATVYIPRLDPGPLPEGPQCDRCDPSGELPGGAVARATSDEAGHFKLDNVPSGSDIPLIIQIGKWRRRALLPTVTSCTDNALPASLTSLPKNKSEGDMPMIAVSTGDSDALECLIRRLGVSDFEFTNGTGPGNVHLYTGNGASSIGSSPLSSSQSNLWANVDQLKRYDIVMLSCEGGQNAGTKPQSAMDAMKAYADLGGRVFASHYHNVWISGETGNATHAPAVWKDIATWGDNYPNASSDVIDQVNNPKGVSFATWMQNVGGSTALGQVAIDPISFRNTALSIDTTKAEQWVYWDSGTHYPQNFQFTTPNEAAQDQRCGKVVFSDMHVAGDSTSSGSFPNGCSTAPLSPQEKALAFMFFDIASCVQVIQ